jgi:phosphoenolpyruvate carboxykinase (GTP)
MQCPVVSPEFNEPRGVPISAILFGGRRTRLVPLVFEAFSWQHGVAMAAGMGTETTSAAEHDVGRLRRDPMAMVPFCGYNMADYFRHWLAMGQRLPAAPKLFFINWFRTDARGEFVWPGFGENIRVLKWIVDRVHGRVSARETPLGLMPHLADLELSGLQISQEALERLFAVHGEAWLGEISEMRQFLEQFGERLPAEISQEIEELERRLEGA